ncbi:MAG: hypothetical protein WKH64_07585 [Chloroflexia bacterium]
MESSARPGCTFDCNLRDRLGFSGYTSPQPDLPARSVGGQYRYTRERPASDIPAALKRGGAVVALVDVDYIQRGVDVDSPHSPAFQNQDRYYSGSFGHRL